MDDITPFGAFGRTGFSTPSRAVDASPTCDRLENTNSTAQATLAAAIAKSGSKPKDGGTIFTSERKTARDFGGKRRTANSSSTATPPRIRQDEPTVAAARSQTRRVFLMKNTRRVECAIDDIGDGEPITRFRRIRRSDARFEILRAK